MSVYFDYYIMDNLSPFFYRYVYRYSSQMNVLDPDVFFDRYIAEDFETNYVPHAFEDVCRQYLIRRNRLGGIEPPFDRIGKYYYDDPRTRTNGEFDVVTEDVNGYIFYEAKFRKEPITQKTVDDEIAQVEATGLKCYRYGFFSRSGVTAKQREDTVFIALSQLYA